MLLDRHRDAEGEPRHFFIGLSGALYRPLSPYREQRAEVLQPGNNTGGGPTPDLLTVWVPDFSDELHLWRSQRVVIGEGEVRFEKPAFTETPGQKLKKSEFRMNVCNVCTLAELPRAAFYLQKGVLWTDDHHLPLIDVIVVDETG